jgi:hypothetical protein
MSGNFSASPFAAIRVIQENCTREDDSRSMVKHVHRSQPGYTDMNTGQVSALHENLNGARHQKFMKISNCHTHPLPPTDFENSFPTSSSWSEDFHIPPGHPIWPRRAEPFPCPHPPPLHIIQQVWSSSMSDSPATFPFRICLPGSA